MPADGQRQIDQELRRRAGGLQNRPPCSSLFSSGGRYSYNHHHEERKLANGGTGIYDYETYRCYRKISSSRTCEGQSVYKATALNEAVENQVRLFLSKLEAVPKERLVELASARNEETYKVAYKQAQKDFENAHKQVTALEEEAVKALTEMLVKEIF